MPTWKESNITKNKLSVSAGRVRSFASGLDPEAIYLDGSLSSVGCISLIFAM